MKKIALIIAFTAIGMYCLAQTNTNYNEKLLSKYTSEELNELLTTQPSLVEFMEFELNSGFQIIELAYDKLEGIPIIKHVDNNTKTTGAEISEYNYHQFNLYSTNYERMYNKNTYYRFANTNQVIIIYSQKELLKRYKQTQED